MVNHAKWTRFEESNGRSNWGSPHNLVFENHLAMKDQFMV